MRPPGEIRQALLSAACELATTSHAPTLRELAAHAQVGLDSARHTVKNMTRAGDLRPHGHRRVGYRNRPVAEYVPATMAEPEPTGNALQDVVRSFWEVAPSTLA